MVDSELHRSSNGHIPTLQAPGRCSSRLLRRVESWEPLLRRISVIFARHRTDIDILLGEAHPFRPKRP